MLLTLFAIKRSDENQPLLLRPLLDNWLFTLPLDLLLAISLIFFINLGAERDFCDAISCFSNFVEASAPLIKLGGALLAWATLVALIHRSAQTHNQLDLARTQIQQTQQRNNVTNFYDSLKEFNTYVEEIHISNMLEIRPRKLYQLIFPQNCPSKCENFVVNNDDLALAFNEFVSDLDDRVAAIYFNLRTEVEEAEDDCDLIIQCIADAYSSLYTEIILLLVSHFQISLAEQKDEEKKERISAIRFAPRVKEEVRHVLLRAARFDTKFLYSSDSFNGKLPYHTDFVSYVTEVRKKNNIKGVYKFIPSINGFTLEFLES